MDISMLVTAKKLAFHLGGGLADALRSDERILIADFCELTGLLIGEGEGNADGPLHFTGDKNDLTTRGTAQGLRL